MKPLLVTVLASLFLFFVSCQKEKEKCEETSYNPSPDICHVRNDDVKSKNCCHVSLRASGQYYSFCHYINHNGSGSKIKDVEKDLEKWYDKVKIDCSGNMIKNSLYIFFLSLFALVF